MAELNALERMQAVLGGAQANLPTGAGTPSVAVPGSAERPDPLARMQAALGVSAAPMATNKTEVSPSVVPPPTEPTSKLMGDPLARMQAALGGVPDSQLSGKENSPEVQSALNPDAQSVAGRFATAWNEPGKNILTKTWGVLNTPVLAESDIEAWLNPLVGDPKEFGSVFGGITKGAYDLVSGMTSPLSLAFLIGSFGAGSLFASGGKALLAKAGKSAAEIAEVVKGSELLTAATKIGKTVEQARLDWMSAGLNPKVIDEGLDILNKAGMTSHDLLKGGLIHTAGSAAIRGAGVSIPKADTIAKTAQILVDGGFSLTNIYGAIVAVPEALDAAADKDWEKAARLITEAAGMSGFGLLGTKAALREAGGMMDPFAAKAGLHVVWNDENIKLRREFGVRDRQMVEAGRVHELRAEELHAEAKAAGINKPEDLQLIYNWIQAGGDENVLRQRFGLIAKSADVQVPAVAEEPALGMAGDLPARGPRTKSSIMKQRLEKYPEAKDALDPLNELTETEMKQLDVGRRKQVFLDVMQRIPVVADLVAAAKKGAVGRDWYERSIQAFDAMRDLAPKYFRTEDADVWAGVVAATSPQQGVPLNLREALDFWKGWVDNGRPTTEKQILKLQRKGKIIHLANQPSKLPNVLKAINREDFLPETKDKYFKVGNFYGDLRGFSDGTTSDSWMGVFFDLAEKDVAKAPFYHAMAVQTRLAARELGWNPGQVQAAIWVFTKTLAEMSGWKVPAGGEFYKPVDLLEFMSNADMASYARDFADILQHDPEVRGRFAMLGGNVNELDKRLKAIHRPEAIEEPVEGATGESLRRSAERIGKRQQNLKGFAGYSKYQPGTEFDFGEGGLDLGKDIGTGRAFVPLPPGEAKTPFEVRATEKLGALLGTVRETGGKDVTAALYKNRRGENTFAVKGEALDVLNAAAPDLLEAAKGRAATPEQTNRLIQVLSRSDNPKAAELVKMLEDVKGENLSLVRLTGPHPFQTMLHEHVHGILTNMEAASIMDTLKGMDGFQQIEQHIKKLGAYQDEAIPGEIMARAVAGQLYEIAGVAPEKIDAILWEALNKAPSDVAYEKLVGNLDPNVRRRLYAYLQPGAEGPRVRAELPSRAATAGGIRTEVGAVPRERGPGRVPAAPGREALAADIEAQINLEHRSNVENLASVDPSKYGTSEVKGAEAKRKAAFPEFWVNRSYFTLKGAPPEALIEGRKHIYGATVPSEALYDLRKDPEGYIGRAQQDLASRGRVPVSEAIISRAEQMMAEDGKSGYIVGNNVAMFKPTEVSKPFALPAEVKTSLEGQNLKEGFTVNPHTGDTPQTGYALEILPENRRILDHDVTPADVEQFVADNKKVFDANPNLNVGGWGREMNISAVIEDKAQAAAIAKKLDQIAVWDFANGKEVATGGEGKKTSFTDYPAEARLKDIRQEPAVAAPPLEKAPAPRGEFSDLSADVDSEAQGTSAARLEELAAKKNIKEKYTPKEIEALLKSYDPSRLTQAHRDLAKKIKAHFDDNLKRAQDAGALADGLEDYVTQMWQKDVDNPAVKRLLAEAHAGNFAVNTSMARHRIFEHAIEGELLGRKLAVTDPIALAAHNGNVFDRVIATRKLLQRLRDKNLRASDGRPMVALSGTGHVVQGPDGDNPAVLVHPDRMHNIRISNEVIQGLKDRGELDKLVKEGKIVKYGDSTRKVATDQPLKLATERAGTEIASGQVNTTATEGAEHYAWVTGDYRSMNHRSFEDWLVPTQDTNGNPVILRSEMKIHPDAYDYLKRQVQTQSEFAKALKPVFAAGREAKGVLLSFDVFHLVQEGLRAVMTGVSPFGVEKWNLRTNPTLGKLVEHGLTMKDYGAIDSFQEGMMVGHSHLLSKVPIVGPAASWFQDFLFQKYVPGLKARAAEHLYERYKKLYPEYPDEKVAQLAAEDTNMRFGGLNLRREGRALVTQDVFRLIALAPDWLESEMRAMSRAMGGEGRVMRRDLAKVAIGLWLSARILNQLNTGDAHYEAPFGVAYRDDKGREKVVSLRTLPTDMLHAVTDPLKFMRYRASPLERTVSTVYTGRDEQGRRLPARDLVWDVLGDSVVPLPLQNVTKKMSGFAPEQDWKELGIRGVGGQVTTFKTEAQKKAAELSADRSESGPVDKDKLKEHANRLDIEDQLRAGLVQTTDIYQMVEQGLMNPKDAKYIIKNVNETRGMDPDMARLYNRASRLPMPEFLETWELATAGEKSVLTKLMLKKKASYFKKAYSEMTPKERQEDATYRRLRELFPETMPF